MRLIISQIRLSNNLTLLVLVATIASHGRDADAAGIQYNMFLKYKALNGPGESVSTKTYSNKEAHHLKLALVPRGNTTIAEIPPSKKLLPTHLYEIIDVVMEITLSKCPRILDRSIFTFIKDPLSRWTASFPAPIVPTDFYSTNYRTLLDCAIAVEGEQSGESNNSFESAYEPDDSKLDGEDRKKRKHKSQKQSEDKQVDDGVAVTDGYRNYRKRRAADESYNLEVFFHQLNDIAESSCKADDKLLDFLRVSTEEYLSWIKTEQSLHIAEDNLEVHGKILAKSLRSCVFIAKGLS